jgi:hypothetical protein
MFIEIKGEQMELLPERAIFWPSMELLMIADIGCAFTKKTLIESGLDELDHIKSIVAKRSVKRVLLLGDVAPEGRSFDKALLHEIKMWSQNIRCPFYIAFPKPAFITPEEIKGYGVAAWADPLIIPPFAFTSEPVELERYFSFSGNTHPQVVLKKGGERHFYPCFQIKEHQAILPSFTDDVPSQSISWTSEEKIYAIDGDTIINI